MKKTALFLLYAPECALQLVNAQPDNYSVTAGKEVDFSHLSQHPLLIANEKNLATIQLQNDHVAPQLLSILIRDSEQNSSALKLTYTDGVSNISTLNILNEPLLASLQEKECDGWTVNRHFGLVCFLDAETTKPIKR